METTGNKPNVLYTQVGGDHYAKYPIQPIEYIQANHLDFAQGNIVKLATRFRDKGGAEDLHKIKQYADILLSLEYVGGQQPTGALYWSSTEGSGDNAWYVNFKLGYSNYTRKYYGFAVRAVSTF